MAQKKRLIDQEKLKTKLPTFYNYLEKRRLAKINQLPKHLRAPEQWPIALQIALNISLLYTFIYLMWYREEFVTEAYPGMAIVICTVFLFYTVPAAIRLRRKFKGIKGSRWTHLNFWIMIIAAFLLPVTIAYFQN